MGNSCQHFIGVHCLRNAGNYLPVDTV